MTRKSPEPQGKRRTLKPYDQLTKNQKRHRDYYLRTRKPLLREQPGFAVKPKGQSAKEYRLRNPEKVKAAHRMAYLRNPKAAKENRDKRWPVGTFGLTRRNAEKNAAARGVSFSLTTKYLNDLYHSQGCVCALSKLRFKRGSGNGPSMFSPSLDRIIPALGYVPGNVRFLLHGVNALKSTGTDDDVRTLIAALAASMLENKLVYFSR